MIILTHLYKHHTLSQVHQDQLTHLRGSEGQLIKTRQVLLPVGGGGGLAGGEQTTELLQKVEIGGWSDRGTPATLLLHPLTLLSVDETSG